MKETSQKMKEENQPNESMRRENYEIIAAPNALHTLIQAAKDTDSN